MKLEFKDYFSDKSENYNQYRPTYPSKLFSYLASISKNHQKAWDCATGNGQSAILLADYFNEVIATDASQNQIESATPKKGVIYRVATAEKSQIEPNSIDLITVAQAYHWFDHDAFIKEISRVLKQGGVIAIWTYNLLSINKELDKIIHHLYDDILGDYWAFERKMVEGGYKEVKLPFNEISPPAFHMSTQWDVSQLIGYLCTWSAVKKYQKEIGVNPVEEIYSDIVNAWGVGGELLPVTWPLSIKVWVA